MRGEYGHRHPPHHVLQLLNSNAINFVHQRAAAATPNPEAVPELATKTIIWQFASALQLPCSMKPSGTVWLGGMAACTTADSPVTTGTAEKSRPAVDLSTAIIQVAEKTIPAVVHIEVTMSREVANPLLPFEKDPFFRRFFGNPKVPPKYKQELMGLGSGMILDAQGHILTNYHVVGSASKIEVVLADGSRHTAKLIGTDPKTDLAVIKISTAEALPTITFGDSDRLRVGEWVVAIGAPRGLDKTVTQGMLPSLYWAPGEASYTSLAR